MTFHSKKNNAVLAIIGIYCFYVFLMYTTKSLSTAMVVLFSIYTIIVSRLLVQKIITFYPDKLVLQKKILHITFKRTNTIVPSEIKRVEFKGDSGIAKFVVIKMKRKESIKLAEFNKENAKMYDALIVFCKSHNIPHKLSADYQLVDRRQVTKENSKAYEELRKNAASNVDK